MITGEDIRRAREARRLSQEQLAALLQVGVRTVGRWERGESIPRSSHGAIEQILGLGGGAPDEPRLSEATDAELLAQLALRLEHSRSDRPQRQQPPPRHAKDAPGAVYYQEPTGRDASGRG